MARYLLATVDAFGRVTYDGYEFLEVDHDLLVKLGLISVDGMTAEEILSIYRDVFEWKRSKLITTACRDRP